MVFPGSTLIKKKKKLSILAALGCHCYMGLSLIVVSGDYAPVVGSTFIVNLLRFDLRQGTVLMLSECLWPEMEMCHPDLLWVFIRVSRAVLSNMVVTGHVWLPGA